MSIEINRKIKILEKLKQKSLFLFGPRQTGKTWLIHHLLKQYKTYNLLESETFVKFNHSPQRIREEIQSTDKFIIIDEIQRLPVLLNEVHSLIEDSGIHFLLTGSNVRKLRRAGCNLLGGRARMEHLHPFSFCELQEKFDLSRAINYGLLPAIYFSANPDADLQAYIALYLREEIAFEGFIRNLPAFSRFLEVAAWCNAKIINYTKIANDAQVPRTTVQEYFAILKDTLLAYELPAWNKSQRRKPISTAKCYWFDNGVVKTLQHRGSLQPETPEFGEAFETYIFHELKVFTDYNEAQSLAYWRSTSGLEVDFILGDATAIEVKASKNVSPQDLKNLIALREEKKLKNYILVCLEKVPRTVNGIKIMPWRMFLENLWGNEF